MQQTDDILRTYPEYDEGKKDKKNGVASRKGDYPLISSGGRFEKKAYLLGYHDM